MRQQIRAVGLRVALWGVRGALDATKRVEGALRDLEAILAPGEFWAVTYPTVRLSHLDDGSTAICECAGFDVCATCSPRGAVVDEAQAWLDGTLRNPEDFAEPVMESVECDAATRGFCVLAPWRCRDCALREALS